MGLQVENAYISLFREASGRFVIQIRGISGKCTCFHISILTAEGKK